MQAPQYHHANGYQEAQYSPSQQVFVSTATPLSPGLGDTMQSQAQFAHMHMNGAPMQHPPPPPTYQPTTFQYQNGMMPPAPMASSVGIPGQNGMMRFPIPPSPMPPGHVVGGMRGRDKSTRRRTKTGCLTCRKRRIKCDEGHPTCRNCQKSKRECLGYDPIFKQETRHAPIQPAPTNPTTPNTKVITSPTSTTYQQPQSYPGTGGTFVPAANHSQTLDGAFEYAPSLDPALAGADHALTMARNSFSTTLNPTRKVKPITMEQLFSLNDIAPRFQIRDAPPPTFSITQQEIDDFYRFHFAQGLDKLFETTWYSSRGSISIQQDPTLLDFVSQCVEQFKTADPSATQALQSLEARLVWQLAIMPRTAAFTSSSTGVANDQLILDVLQRIDIIEYLLTGRCLPREGVPPPPTAAQHEDAIKYNELNFWHHLGSFTSHPDDNPDPLVTQAINKNLNTMRGILGVMETRDVLYSIAIARYIGGRLEEFHPRQPLVASSSDPNDELNKLEVARRHIDTEDQRGTTQVIQRICGMAIRSWVLQKQ